MVDQSLYLPKKMLFILLINHNTTNSCDLYRNLTYCVLFDFDSYDNHIRELLQESLPLQKLKNMERRKDLLREDPTVDKSRIKCGSTAPSRWQDNSRPCLMPLSMEEPVPHCVRNATVLLDT